MKTHSKQQSMKQGPMGIHTAIPTQSPSCYCSDANRETLLSIRLSICPTGD